MKIIENISVDLALKIKNISMWTENIDDIS